MKVILSRKGFDARAGGAPSPILPDGTLLSLPIPAKNDKLSYADLYYKGVTYSEILAQLKPRNKKIGKWHCHLDPDIRDGVRTVEADNWQPAFGQCGASQTYLNNQQVGAGDLFLFFGWFKQTEGDLKKGTLRYVKGAPDLHVLYGYFQVGEVVTDKKTLWESYSWHPHALEHFTSKRSNALYLPTDCLTFASQKKGSGTFDFSESKVLTLPGHGRATWREIPALLPENICRNSKNIASKGGISYGGPWQELVLKENRLSEEWAIGLF